LDKKDFNVCFAVDVLLMLGDSIGQISPNNVTSSQTTITQWMARYAVRPVSY